MTKKLDCNTIEYTMVFLYVIAAFSNLFGVVCGQRTFDAELRFYLREIIDPY